MEFDIKKYLVENNLTTLSSVKEEEDNGDSRMSYDTSTKLMAPPEDEDDFEDDEPEDNWNSDEDYEDNDEIEPSVGDVKQQDASLTGIHKKQVELRALEDKKDALLMQLKSNIIGLDQYREQIGNIPTRIKALRADLEQAMNVSIDDNSEEEAS